MLLLLAAVVLAVGTGEYPGLTAPALRFMATEVVPPLIVAVLNLGAFAGANVVPAWRSWPALASSAALLAAVLPDVGRGAPPVSIALPVLAATLLIAGIVIERDRRARA